ncbi:sensor histidine kinase [Tepidibacter aestuarii]|uniref:sensor histidine kinase n=1 Tax=Tepidibacter aestuarii TaxID=2925782 RepID=UPI0020C1385E|nr:sensor histidine kinase [Tepidibacter aestuarii]CAH2214568.1 Histidine kinase [Tepidibacter aestuarii]
MKSLKKKIMIPVFLLSIIGILILSFVVYNKSKHIIIDYVELLAQNKAQKLVVDVEYHLEKWKSAVSMLASIDTTKNMDYEELKKYISNNKELDDKEYDFFLIADTNGNYLSTIGANGNIKDRDYFHEVISSGNTTISKPIISKSTGNYIIVVAAPIKDDNENIIGLVGVGVNLSTITDIINDEKLGTSGYAYMISKNGLVMAHANKNLIYKCNILNDENKSVVDFGKKMINGEVGIRYYELYGTKKIVSYMPIKSTGWSIGMSVNYDEETKSILVLRNYILLIGIGITVLILILLNYLTDTLVKPINKLKKHMEIATKGDLSVQCDIDSKDEIGVLSKSFNTLIKENKRLLEETLEYDRLKTEFFSNISHELKTPLNIIFSTTQLLPLYVENDNENFETAKINKHINIMKQNCYRLLRLVNNLIDITKIDSGFVELNLQNKNIVEVIENITLSTVEYAKSKSRTIIFDTNVEERIIAFDPEQMERIILNLISNAIKFTKPNDEIEVKIYDGAENIIISVKDTGIGIPKEKQEMIFERFRQVDHLLCRKHEGSGIGLSLIKSLIELHGGKISVKSEYGKGTEFIIELPIKTIDEEENIYTLDDFAQQTNVEKIHIEFSDIYE